MRANLSKRPTIARLREVVSYDPATGILTWLITSGRAIAGREAGCFDRATGYWRIRIDGQAIMSHHVAYALMTGVWPERLDHRYGKENGNRWENLRPSTQSQNMGNIGRPAHNTSGVKGVSLHKATGKWQAQIGINGKRTWLGCRDTKEEAAELYEAAAIEHFGEFARSENFPIAKMQAKGPAVPHRKRGRPTPEEVRAALCYDPETGLLTWPGGKTAGRLTEDGYIKIGLFWRHYLGHILAWVIMNGVWPTHKVDHENNVRNDNRWLNLREGTQSQNIANTRRSARNSSGFKGVSFERATRKWAAFIKVAGVSRRIGSYQSPEEAHAAYQQEATLAWGSFAKFD